MSIRTTVVNPSGETLSIIRRDGSADIEIEVVTDHVSKFILTEDDRLQSPETLNLGLRR